MFFVTVADEELVMSHLLFSKDWQEKIGNLRIKDSITFEGRIDRIESDDVVLIEYPLKAGHLLTSMT